MYNSLFSSLRNFSISNTLSPRNPPERNCSTERTPRMTRDWKQRLNFIFTKNPSSPRDSSERNSSTERTQRMMQNWKQMLNFICAKNPSPPRNPSERNSSTEITQRMMQNWKQMLNFIFAKIPKTTCFPSRASKEPPVVYRCPILGSLMYDPVMVPSGQTFESAFIEACRELNYIPSSLRLQTNDDLKSMIINWCDRVGHPHPRPISREEARDSAKRCMALHELFWTVFPKIADNGNGSLLGSSSCPDSSSILESSNSRIVEGSIARPSSSSVQRPSATVFFDDLVNIKNLLMKLEVENTSSSAVASPPTSLPSTEAVEVVRSSGSNTVASPLEVEILKKLNDAEVSIREEALVTLLEAARESVDNKISLCNNRILSAVLPKLHNRHPPIIIIRATAFLVTLSAEPANRFKIGQSSAVPRLTSVLKNRDVAARDLAALALSNLALEKNNWESIGLTPGAMAALVDHLCETAGNFKGRKYAGMALYHLCLSCPDNLMRLAKIAGAAQKLLAVATDRASDEATSLASIAMVVVCKLAWISEAREELIYAGVMGEMVKMMRDEEEYERYYLAVMYLICYHNRLLFKALAVSLGAEEVLLRDKEEWGEVGREMARRMLEVIRQDKHESVNLLQLQSVTGEVEGEEEEEEVADI